MGRAPCRVLIVEDNLDGAMALLMLVRQMGHQAEYALSGDAALRTARRLRPDTVFLDIGLPGGIDGYEVARQLRSDFGSTVRIIAITAYGADADRQRAMEAGIDLHLIKPADIKMVESLLG